MTRKTDLLGQNTENVYVKRRIKITPLLPQKSAFSSGFFCISWTDHKIGTEIEVDVDWNIYYDLILS